MLPVDKLEHLTRRYAELDELLCRPDVLSDRNQLSKLNKERTELEPIVQAFGRFRTLEKQIAENEEALADPELRELAQGELTGLVSERASLEKELEVLLLPADPNDKKNVILEIRG